MKVVTETAGRKIKKFLTADRTANRGNFRNFTNLFPVLLHAF